MASIGIADKATLDTVNTKTSTILTTTNDIYSVTGGNWDVASPDGTTHGKLKDIRTKIDVLASPLQKIRTTKRGKVRPNSSEYMTLLNITGRGSLKLIGLVSYGPTATNTYAATVKITIDGIVIGEGVGWVRNDSANYHAVLPAPIFFLSPRIDRKNSFTQPVLDTGEEIFNMPASFFDIPFKNSLLIEGIGSAEVAWVYEIE